MFLISHICRAGEESQEKGKVDSCFTTAVSHVAFCVTCHSWNSNYKLFKFVLCQTLTVVALVALHCVLATSSAKVFYLGEETETCELKEFCSLTPETSCFTLMALLRLILRPFYNL